MSAANTKAMKLPAKVKGTPLRTGHAGKEDTGRIAELEGALAIARKQLRATASKLRSANKARELQLAALHRSTARLLKSQELIHSVFHTADIGLAVFDEKGRYLKTNKGFNKLFGYKTGELKGQHFSVMFPPENKKLLLEKYRELLSKKKVAEELLAKKKDGSVFPVFRTAQLLQDTDGSRYTVITVRDISEIRKYQFLLQNTEKVAQIGGWKMNTASGKVTRTEELYRILEMNEREINHLTFSQKLERFYEPASRPVLRKAMQQAIRQGISFDLELRIITGSGGNKWVRVTGSPEYELSKIVRLVGTMQDITARKESEEALERLSLVASKSNNAVFITDEQGRTLWINEAVERLTGYSMADLAGKTPGEVLQGPDTDQAAIARIRKALKKREAVSEVIKNYRKDGGAFWINMDIAPVFKNDLLIYFIGVGVDVTELVLAREIARSRNDQEQQQKLFEAIAQNFPDGIIGVLDNRLHYVFAGGSEIRRLGLTRDQFIGNPIFDHLSRNSNSEAAPYLHQALEGKPVSFEVEMKDWTYSVNAVPLTGEKDNNTRILVVLYNITHRKKAEVELREALIRQKELTELKSKFVTIASHEFRTPLTAILSSTFLIARYSKLHEEEKAQKHIGRIETAVRTLTDILNDFLSLGQIEEGKLINRVAGLEVGDFCRSVVDEIQPSLKMDQTVVYKHKGKQTVFSLDKQHLKTILVNLLSNAAKYSTEGDWIWLTSEIANGQLRVSVRDAGIGIPQKDQPRLFQTFFRANNAANIQGTGMGLHIVKRVLDLMGGTIHFTSIENRGSTFWILIPAPGQSLQNR